MVSNPCAVGGYSMDSEIHAAEVESLNSSVIDDLLKLMINFLSFQCLKLAGDMEQKEVLMSGFWELSRRLGAAGFFPKHVKQATNPPDVKQITFRG
jgi:hypothetical protein